MLLYESTKKSSDYCVYKYRQYEELCRLVLGLWAKAEEEEESRQTFYQ